MIEREKIELAIAAQESLRPLLGDAVVDATISALRQKLSEGEQPRPAAGQRKQVTVLFGDVSGFTAMSETMDAEDVSGVMNTLWARVDAAITAHGGMVDKHIGDAVMAIFGASTSHEDDPERAVRAALAMQAELLEFAEKNRHSLKMRIGVNTGPVLLGTVGSRSEFTAMGDTVNLASRLEHAAPVGGVLISHDVYRHVRGVFEVETMEPLAVKGKKEPIQTYIVKKAKPRVFDGGGRGAGIETPMIGRDAELALMQGALRKAIEGSQSRMATVVGEAGLGKSRLLLEFDHWVELLPERLWYFKGRASAHTVNAPYGLLRDLFAFRFEIMESDDAATVRAKMESGVSGFLAGDPDAVAKAHFIGQLVGYDFSGSPYLQGVQGSAQQARDQALAYLGQFFAAAAARMPVLILLEDIHWADERSLDAVTHMIAAHPNLRLLTVSLARPALFERLPAWAESSPRRDTVVLKPLSARDSGRLVGEILRKAGDVPPQLRDLIVANADGNPFYVEELVKMLCEEGVIVKGEESWKVEIGRLAELKVPPTLTGVLQARLDGLTDAARGTLQRASVIGRIFWDGALDRLAEGKPGDRQAALGGLRGKEMVFRRDGSAFAGEQEYIFKHALMRDVVYESVLKSARLKFHGQVAEWLVAQSGERVGEYAALIAAHYENAGDGGKAAEFLERAGAQALRLSANREAQAALQRALALLPDKTGDVKARIELTRLLGEAHVGLSAFPEARECYEKSLALATGCGDGPSAAKAHNGLSYAADRLGDYAAARSHAEAAVELSRAAGDKQTLVRGLSNLSVSCLEEGRNDEAKKLAQESLALSLGLGDAIETMRCFNRLGNVCYQMDAFAEAKRHYHGSLDIARETGNRCGVAAGLFNTGNVSVQLHEWDEARGMIRDAFVIFKEIGDKYGMASSLEGLGDLELGQGDYPAAQRHYRDALRIAQEIGSAAAMLCDITGLIGVAAKEGHAGPALEGLGLVLAHAATPPETMRKAEALLPELRSRLPPAAADAALERGRLMALEDAVKAALSIRP